MYITLCASVLVALQGVRNEKWVTYREDKAVFEVGKLFVTLLTAEHSILLVDHFFVAVLAGTGLVKAVLLAQVDDSCDAGVVVSLKRRYEPKPHLFAHCTCQLSGSTQSDKKNDIQTFWRSYRAGILMPPRQKHTDPDRNANQNCNNFRNAWKNSTQEIFTTKVTWTSDSG